MKRVLLLVWLLSGSLPAQTTAEQKQMRQILENLAQGRPQAEDQIDWEHLQIDKAPGLPHYQELNPNQQAAFRKATLRSLRPHLENLRPGRDGQDLTLERPGVQFRFHKTPRGLKLGAIRQP